MIIENYKSLEAYFRDFIVKEFKNLMETEFENHFKELPYPVVVRFFSGVDRVWFNLFRHKNGHITKKFVLNGLTKLRKTEYCETFSAAYDVYLDNNDNSVIGGITLDVSTVSLNRCILENLHNLEEFKEVIKLVIHHEIGHMIDYHSFHNKPMQDFINFHESHNKDFNNFLKWKDENPDATADEVNEKYQQLSAEKTADILGGLTLQDRNRINKFYKTKQDPNLKIEIRVVNEGENND